MKRRMEDLSEERRWRRKNPTPLETLKTTEDKKYRKAIQQEKLYFLKRDKRVVVHFTKKILNFMKLLNARGMNRHPRTNILLIKDYCSIDTIRGDLPSQVRFLSFLLYILYV